MPSRRWTIFQPPDRKPAPAADRFVIQINLGSDVLKFDKSIEINPNDIDPNDTGTAPQGPWPVIAANKRKDDGDGEPL